MRVGCLCILVKNYDNFKRSKPLLLLVDFPYIVAHFAQCYSLNKKLGLVEASILKKHITYIYTSSLHTHCKSHLKTKILIIMEYWSQL